MQTCMQPNCNEDLTVEYFDSCFALNLRRLTVIYFHLPQGVFALITPSEVSVDYFAQLSVMVLFIVNTSCTMSLCGCSLNGLTCRCFFFLQTNQIISREIQRRFC